MNIDDLKPQGVEDNTAMPVSQPASVPQTPVSSAPENSIPVMSPELVAQTTNIPVTPVAPAENQLSPFSAPPVQTEVTTEAPAVASFTPVDQVIPPESTTLVAPESSVVDNNQVPPVAIAPQMTAPAPVVEPTVAQPSDLPPLPEPSVAPMLEQEVTVVNTAKKHSSSNLFLIILALGLVLFVWKIDEVIAYVQDNIIAKNPTSPGDTTTDNTVEGFVKIDDGVSDTVIKEIRFYNFKKQTDNKLLINFTSTKNYPKANELGIYIEIYNSNKELLSKHKFTRESIGNSEVGSTILDLGEDVNKYAYYAKVVIYTEEELKSTSTLTCTYSEANENYLLEYNTKYSFTNNELKSYDVTKKIEVINNNKATNNAISIITKEKDDVSKFEIATTYDNNVLTYSINLDNVNEGYIPYYSKGTTPTIININESAKKWICE